MVLVCDCHGHAINGVGLLAIVSMDLAVEETKLLHTGEDGGI